LVMENIEFGGSQKPELLGRQLALWVPPKKKSQFKRLTIVQARTERTIFWWFTLQATDFEI
jgi:hypothetical protein